MIVGEDIAARIDDETGTKRALLLLLRILVHLRRAEKVVEEVLHAVIRTLLAATSAIVIALSTLTVLAIRAALPVLGAVAALPALLRPVLGRISVLILTTAGPTSFAILVKLVERSTGLGTVNGVASRLSTVLS